MVHHPHRVFLATASLLAGLVFLASPTPTSACSCYGIPLASRLRQTTALFEGRVIDYQPAGWRYVNGVLDPQSLLATARFRVDKSWKGPLVGEIEVVNRFTGCSYEGFVLDRSYIVWANLQDGAFHSDFGNCGATTESAYLPVLGDYQAFLDRLPPADAQRPLQLLALGLLGIVWRLSRGPVAAHLRERIPLNVALSLLLTALVLTSFLLNDVARYYGASLFSLDLAEFRLAPLLIPVFYLVLLPTFGYVLAQIACARRGGRLPVPTIGFILFLGRGILNEVTWQRSQWI